MCHFLLNQENWDFVSFIVKIFNLTHSLKFLNLTVDFAERIFPSRYLLVLFILQFLHSEIEGFCFLFFAALAWTISRIGYFHAFCFSFCASYAQLGGTCGQHYTVPVFFVLESTFPEPFSPGFLVWTDRLGCGVSLPRFPHTLSIKKKNYWLETLSVLRTAVQLWVLHQN